MKILRFKMLCSLVLAFLISVLTYIYLKKDYITVVVAKTDILPYTTITSKMLEEKIVPSEYSEFFDGFVSKGADVIGWVSGVKINKGYPVIKKSEFMFSPTYEEGYIPANYCIVGIELDRCIISAKKGDIVDLYLTVPSDVALNVPMLKELDNECPPENLILEANYNGYVFRNIILREITGSDESAMGTVEANIILNKKYVDLIMYSKNSNAKMDIALKGCISSE